MRPCPTCLASHRLLTISHLRLSPKGFLATRARLPSLFLAKRSVTSATTTTSPPTGVEPLTVLHKTVALLPRIPNYDEGSNSRYTEANRLWEATLSKAYEDFSAVSDRPIRIAVLGVDEWSKPQDVVTALLADPLSSNEEHFAQMSSRWLDPSLQKMEIMYGPENSFTLPTVRSTSPFLTQFPAPVELFEFRAPSLDPTAGLSQILQNPIIYEVDIPMIVCNPLTISLSSVLSSRLPVNTILIVTSTFSQGDLNAIVHHHSSSLPSSRRLHSSTPDVVSVDPRRAVEAIRAIQSQHNSLPAIQKFQNDFLGSNISSVAHALRKKMGNLPSSPLIRKKMAISHVKNALQWSSFRVLDLHNTLDKAFVDVSALEARMEEIRVTVESRVLASHGDSDRKLERSAVQEATQEAEVRLKEIMASLSWWRMIWKVDEISTIISSALRDLWCSNLEKKLLLSTGELSVLQADITESAFALLAKHRAVDTAVLGNALLQCKTSLGYPLTAATLTGPIQLRRDQLIEYPTMRLHIAGQRAVLVAATGVMSGIGISWAGWMGWLLGTGEGLLGVITLEPGTAIGLGMLTAAAGVRWTIGLWEKAKKRWWEDWNRVGAGLDRDLKATLNQAMDRQVLVVGQTACKDLIQLIRAREQELAELSKDLQEVELGLNAIVDDVHRKS